MVPSYIYIFNILQMLFIQNVLPKCFHTSKHQHTITEVYNSLKDNVWKKNM